MTKDEIQLISEHCFKVDRTVNGRCNDKSWWIKRDLEFLYVSIIANTAFLPDDAAINIRLFHILNDVFYKPKCEAPWCNNTVKWHKSTNRYSKFCSPGCNSMFHRKVGEANTFSKEATKKKIKLTNLEKYGVDNYAKTDEFRARMNVRSASLTEEQKNCTIQKRKNTNLEKYGFTSPLQNEEVSRKSKDSLRERYGVEYPLQSSEILQKAKTTNFLRYGTESYQQSHLDPHFLDKLKSKEWVNSQLESKSLKILATENNIAYSTLCDKITNLGISLTNYSYFEKEVGEYIRSLGVDFETNNKSILNGKEIDIFIPTLNLGIECDGVYWHGEKKGKDRNYHLKKTTDAKEKNVQLLHIFENEWLTKRPITESRITTLLGKNERFYARKSKIIEVDTQDERNFMNDNHLQGHTYSRICYGLVNENNELLSVMSFGKSRFNKNYEWELIRYAALNKISVVGGPNKLFSHFTKLHSPKNIISYCDLRWFTGKMYKNLGFTFQHNSSPNYYYIEANGTLTNRMKYQKHKLKSKLKTFDSNLSEWENMKNNGYDRIWDCGNSVWLWNA